MSLSFTGNTPPGGIVTGTVGVILVASDMTTEIAAAATNAYDQRCCAHKGFVFTLRTWLISCLTQIRLTNKLEFAAIRAV